ncbi:MAG: hypothetical protein AAF449_09010 [Myxococcota bacterium]
MPYPEKSPFSASTLLERARDKTEEAPSSTRSKPRIRPGAAPDRAERAPRSRRVWRSSSRRPIAVGDIKVPGLGTLSADRTQITKGIKALVRQRGAVRIEKVVHRAIRTAHKKRNLALKKGDRRAWSQADVLIRRLNHAQRVISATRLQGR